MPSCAFPGEAHADRSAFALAVLVAILPEPAAVLVAAVVFGLAHLYQGVAGVLLTSVLAVALGALNVATDSLLPGMVLHVLIDLRVLASRPPPDRVAAVPGPLTDPRAERRG